MKLHSKEVSHWGSNFWKYVWKIKTGLDNKLRGMLTKNKITQHQLSGGQYIIGSEIRSEYQ